MLTEIHIRQEAVFLFQSKGFCPLIGMLYLVQLLTLQYLILPLLVDCGS